MRAGNLPVAVTSFAGRDAELLAARKVLTHHRLLTLTGPGGVGKSRVAHRLGEDLRRVFPGGVWLVDLASAAPGTDVGGLLPVVLDHRGALVILDNCEHLLAECAEFITATLRGDTAAHILVTSRQTVGMLGEHVLEIGPLGTADAVRLFTERAGVDLPSAAEVCRRLDGLPLAIELAALAPSDLLDRPADPAWVLRLSSRAALPRQRSLHASLSWSHELCSVPERRLWARLSVFAGWFDLAAAVAVCSGNGIDDVFGLLAGLVEKSVVSRDGDGYRLLASTRHFGATLLPDTMHYREKHARYFTQRATRLLDAPVARAHADFAAAVDFLMTQGNRAEEALPAATLLCLCPSDGRTDRRRLTEVLRHATSARALVAAGMSALAAGDDAATSLLQEAATLADPSVLAYLVESAGLRAAATGDLDTACCLLAQAFMAHAGRADEYGIRQSYRHLLVVGWVSGDPRRAARARALPSEAGVALIPGWAPYAAVAAGLAHLRESAADEAAACLGTALTALRRDGDRWWLALCCDALALCAQLRGDDHKAARLLGFSNARWASLDVAETFVGGRLAPRGADVGAAPSLDEIVALVRSDRPPPALAEGLTPREVEVAELVCLGLTNRAIGEALSVSSRTVESHVEHIMTKLGCARRTQVAARFTSATRSG